MKLLSILLPETEFNHKDKVSFNVFVHPRLKPVPAQSSQGRCLLPAYPCSSLRNLDIFRWVLP